MAVNVTLPRTGVAAAYTSILADLDVAIQGLPVLNTAICYANVSDAKLLKARVLMNRGAAGDYTQVIALTNDIITNGPFSLEDSVKDIFQNKGLTSNEVMLGIQPYPKEGFKWRYNTYTATDSMISMLSGDARSQWVYSQLAPYGDTIPQITKYYSGAAVNPAPTALSTDCCS